MGKISKTSNGNIVVENELVVKINKNKVIFTYIVIRTSEHSKNNFSTFS